jgi:hypothetical protein
MGGSRIVVVRQTIGFTVGAFRFFGLRPISPGYALSGGLRDLLLPKRPRAMCIGSDSSPSPLLCSNDLTLYRQLRYQARASLG